MLQSFLLSFAVIFLAELGDKSQLMAMTFATRYRFWTVVSAIAAATAIVQFISVSVGAAIGSALPHAPINIVASLLFLGFAAWTLREQDAQKQADERAKAAVRGKRSAFFAIAGTFFLAELGDKTMVAAATLATTEDPFGTWLGATLGMVLAGAIAIVVGNILGRKLPEHYVRYGSAALFFVFGAVLLYRGLVGL